MVAEEDPSTDVRAFRGLSDFLKLDTIGHESQIQTPFGPRKLIYADFTASGRALKSFESHITQEILPVYGNVHSESTWTARQSSYYRQEARGIIRSYFRASHEDAVIFAGNGATGAVHRFIEILDRGGWKANTQVDLRMVEETRWHSFICKPCKLQIKDESALKCHLTSQSHIELASSAQEIGRKLRIIIFLLDPSLHHSSFLPFKELRDRVEGDTQFVFMSEFLNFDPKTGACDLEHLSKMLKSAEEARNDAQQRYGGIEDVLVQTYCIISGCSNITGVKLPQEKVCDIIHKHQAFAIWDMASATGHTSIDLNPRGEKGGGHLDAAFISPHKLIGGPDTPGILLVKRRLMVNDVPSLPGGGVVRFVSCDQQLYSMNSEEREEAGTPNIVACIRAGMVFRLSSLMSQSLVTARELEYLNFLIKSWQSKDSIQILGPLVIPEVWDNPSSITTNVKLASDTLLAQRKAVVSFMVKYRSDEVIEDPECATMVSEVDSVISENLHVKSYLNRKCRGGLYLHHNFVCAVLNDVFGIQARPGCACAGPLAHELLGLDKKMTDAFSDCLEQTGAEVLRPGFVRISLHYTMDWDEIEIIGAAVEWVARVGWKLLPFYTFKTATGEWEQTLTKPSKFREWISKMHLDFDGRLYRLSMSDAAATTEGVNRTSTDIGKRDPRRIVGAVPLPGLGPVGDELKNTLLKRRGELKKAGHTSASVSQPPPKPEFGDGGPLKPSEIKRRRTLEKSAVEPKSADRRGSDGSERIVKPPVSKPVEKQRAVQSVEVLCSGSTSVPASSEPPKVEEEDAIFDPDLVFAVTRQDHRVPEEQYDFQVAADRLVDALSTKMDKTSVSFERRLANLNKRGLTPPLPASFAHLLWFALPGDAVKSLGLFDPNCKDNRDAQPTIVDQPCSIGWPAWTGAQGNTPVKRPTSSPFEPKVYPPVECAKWVFDELNLNQPAEKKFRLSDSPLSSRPSPQLVRKFSESAAPRPVADQPKMQTPTASGLASPLDDTSTPDDEAVKSKVPKSLRKVVGKAISTFDMIREGDQILVALSGGKDSLTMLHVLLDLRSRSPVKFSIAAATVDPQTPEYNPKPLMPYLESLGIPYHMLCYPIIELAKEKMQKDSLCAFCARMKRGLLCTCMKSHGYNVLALGQHMDDIAESFLMSAFYNGALNTMKAHYVTTDGNLRIIRPMIFAREKDLAEFAAVNQLPVITDNCPACFSAPTERIRIKHMIAQQEYEYPKTVSSLAKALMPLMGVQSTGKRSVEVAMLPRQDTDDCGGMCARQL